MKKHLPNILLVTVVLANILFMGLYIRSNGLGQFLSTSGIIFLVLGIIIFIFFLSIDPGYGWIKSIDLTKNYIMIFTAMAVSMAGVVFIVTGSHLHDLHLQSLHEEKRCQELIAGNAEEILKEDWFSLRDHVNQQPFNIYLFQKKSDRNMYKIITIVDVEKAGQQTGSITISSQFISEPLTVSMENAMCPSVIEENIRLDFYRQQELSENVYFELLITFINGTVPGTDQPSKEKILVHLEDKTTESESNSGNRAELIGYTVEQPVH